MFRRVVSLLLLPFVLLTQSAALGHSHGGSQPAGHDLCPHFHTNPITYPCSHGHHHHGPDGHHHQHHHDGDDVPETDRQPTPEPEPQSDHDSDAVYVTSIDVVINERSAVDNEFSAPSGWVTAGSNPSIASRTNPSQEAARWTHPPPASGYICPLYVRHLALLI